MKRKTNLFYTNGDDSRFITFSNYTESLTGNFLSVNTKIYPVKFLCFDIQYLHQDQSENIEEYNNKKEIFIKYLVRYYENKLAFLRDQFGSDIKNAEIKINPLGYLLDAIRHFNDGEYGPINELNKLTYIGNVSENDYNGVYADTICIVEENLIPLKYTFYDTTKIAENINYNSNANILYGWDLVELNNNYNNLAPIFDENNVYNCLASTSSLQISQAKTKNDLSFNILIPLYNLQNVDYTTSEYDQINNKIYPNAYEINVSECGQLNLVPYGIWFSGPNNITLKYDYANNIRTNWSLALSSQFKPFPYANAEMGDRDKESLISTEVTQAAFSTFAGILKNYEKLSEQFLTMNKAILSLQTQLKTTNQKLNDLLLTNETNSQLDFAKRLNAIEAELKEITLNS